MRAKIIQKRETAGKVREDLKNFLSNIIHTNEIAGQTTSSFPFELSVNDSALFSPMANSGSRNEHSV